MVIDEDITWHLSDWIEFDEMLVDVAAANNVEVPRLLYWLYLKRFCELRPFRFWHPHIEYQRFYTEFRDQTFLEGAVLVEFLLGSDCLPDEKTLWAFKNGGVVFWKKSVVSKWLRSQDASVPDSWLVTEIPVASVKSSELITEHWVTKAQILEQKWPLPDVTPL